MGRKIRTMATVVRVVVKGSKRGLDRPTKDSCPGLIGRGRRCGKKIKPGKHDTCGAVGCMAQAVARWEEEGED